MKINKLAVTAGAVVVAASISQLSAQTTLIDDSFTSFNTSTWTGTSSGGASNPARVWNGSRYVVRTQVTSPNPSQYSFFTSNQTDINPFDSALEVSVSFDMISNPPLNDAESQFFAIIGEADTDSLGNYYPSTSNFDMGTGALVLSISQRTSDFLLKLVDYGGGNGSTIGEYEISAMPSNLTWGLDGTGGNKNWTIALSGATFTDTGLSDKGGSFSNYSEGTVSRLSLGAMNGAGGLGDWTSGTNIYFEGLNVTAAIPEPNAALAVGLLAAAGVAMRRRKN
ncbi:PEP-CTERM sorting domain-containing protein [Puniceicoccus vermicola]|uniref:PEP-CTERM sorting domain-containing protein n=1 Tax=Puniceicoccus vermicola TaxID=388746 RepID=A0A7X1AUP1_9BACT|nr:PEP-CTERM sorting domain-containing protein [Puniceicoccus vermicola]MBC2600331.1 PEP-CTERM sorting domain-containing protein [Puniceicoccus vermicola]